MEKPSPSYDISSRFALHTREDSEKNERYYDRYPRYTSGGDEERAALFGAETFQFTPQPISCIYRAGGGPRAS